MEIGKGLREIIVEPLELPAPLRPASEPTPVEKPVKAEPEKERVEK